MMKSSSCPLAAPATATTLSKLITASATTMVQIALGRLECLLDGALILLLAAHELDRDMQQDEATGHLQQGHRQQTAR